MATVRFSDTLKGDIRHNAKNMFVDKIAQAVDNVPAHWADKVYECFFPADVRQKMASLPDYCLLYTSPSPRDQRGSRMPSSA